LHCIDPDSGTIEILSARSQNARQDHGSKQLVVSQVEADYVRRMFDLAAKGRRPQEIADLANAEVWRTHSPGRWTARQVLKMLSNPAYIGEIRTATGHSLDRIPRL
jgi:hypothetical protein